MKIWAFCGAFVVAAIWAGAASAQGQTFSLDAASPSLAPPGTDADDLFSPVFPTVTAAGVGAPFEVDAFSFQQPSLLFDAGGITSVDFSVDRVAVGIPGTAVFSEMIGGGPGQAAADIYRTTAPFAFPANVQLYDGNGVAPPPTASPALGLSEGPAGDNIDGLDLAAPSPYIFWSVDAATAAVGYGGGVSEADILWAPFAALYDAPTPGVYAPAAALGLGTSGAGDDIDALVVFDNNSNRVFDAGDYVLFSLTPTSPTLVSNSWSPGDVLQAFGGVPGGGIGIALPSGALGLIAADNLDALSVSVFVIPEPGGWFVFAALLGLAPFARGFRRKRVP